MSDLSTIRPIMPFDAGHSATVYSVVWPETERVVRACCNGESLENMIRRHRAPHTKMQDAYGPDWAAAWWDWAGVSDQPVSIWPEFYPTSGASEALREIINGLSGGRGDLVVFAGEYEGYAAIAEGQGITVHRVPREQWRATVNEWAINPPFSNAQWWTSQPSAIDGCWWPDWSEWSHAVSALPCEIWADLTYIGATHTHQKVDITSPALAGVVFSLSKPAGVYYRRIGGCFSRRPISGLWGNRWFKNIDSIHLGMSWIAAHSRDHIVRTYGHHQARILTAWNAADASTGIPACHAWQASDVLLLAHASVRPLQNELLRRGHGHRVCLTPAYHDAVWGDVS